ncbi:MAG TPA: hypothetical protein VMW46_00785 [Candidatus Desulfaltia sp.]|nr:hypothetical protein [Candidatus Desulfaltia sp.]
MGIVTCGVHGCRCCWRCDRCPKCEAEKADHYSRRGRFVKGVAWKLQKGDYCPDCVKKIKADGYVWNEFYKNYVSPETAAAVAGQAVLKF